MKHPLIGKALFIYALVWLVIILAHTSILHFHYKIPLLISGADAILANVLMASIGLSYWYVTQFVSPSNQGMTGSIISHALAVLITISAINVGSVTLLTQIFSSQSSYILFLNGTIIGRIVIGTLYLSLVLLVYYLLDYNSDLKEKEEHELQMQHLLKQSELEMLKFQINPHFIFNSLNSISSLTITDPENAREMVIKLSDFLRSSLGKNAPESHTLRDELYQMSLYLDIEKIRFGERLKDNREVEDKCLDMKLPNMILQPLYENAIKFGIYERLGDLHVTTECSCEDGNLSISISNDYDSECVPQKGKGIGLKNVRNRLELIYGLNGLVTIKKQRKIFTVKILIPQTL